MRKLLRPTPMVKVTFSHENICLKMSACAVQVWSMHYRAYYSGCSGQAYGCGESASSTVCHKTDFSGCLAAVNTKSQFGSVIGADLCQTTSIATSYNASYCGLLPVAPTDPTTTATAVNGRAWMQTQAFGNAFVDYVRVGSKPATGGCLRCCLSMRGRGTCVLPCLISRAALTSLPHGLHDPISQLWCPNDVSKAQNMHVSRRL